MDQLNLTFVDRCVEQLGNSQDKVLAILQAVQSEYGYLPEEALERICEITDITPANITGISTFYDFFRHKPAGKHIVRVCIGTACHVKGADAVHQAFNRHLDIQPGDDTDAGGLFTIEKVACL
jgi:NADH-quinone oxidoreductase subunit F